MQRTISKTTCDDNFRSIDKLCNFVVNEMNTCVPELSEEVLDEIEQDAMEWALSKGKY